MGRVGEDRLEEVGSMNHFGVGINMLGKVIIMRSVILPMTKDKALNLAAWLVALADDPKDPKFGKLLRTVMDT